MASPLDPTKSEVFRFEKRAKLNKDRRRNTSELPYLEKLRTTGRGKNWVLRMAPTLLFTWSFLTYAFDPAQVSVLDWVSIGLHRLGHALWGSVLNETGPYIGGIFFQLMIPLALVEYCRRKDDPFYLATASGVLCTNLLWLSTYAAGTSTGAIPNRLMGETVHDWYYMLDAIRAVELAYIISTTLRMGALLALGACLYVIVYQLYFMITIEDRRVAARRERRERDERAAAKHVFGEHIDRQRR
jgi:hypothetical protein